MKQRILALALACMMAFSLVACGGNPAASTSAPASESKSDSQSATQENVTLRFSWWGGDERLAATMSVIEQFQELHPNIKIEAEYGSSDGYNDKLATQLAAGTEPDIMQIEPGHMGILVSEETNYFVDLLQTGFDLSQFEESYISQRINGRYNGKQVGLPTGIAGIALLVNDDLAKEIGIDFTGEYTWDDLITWGKKVREYDDSMYLLCSNKEYLSNIAARTYAKQVTGKQVISDDTKENLMTEEDWLKVYEMVQQLYDNEVVAPASYTAAYSGDNMQSDPNWIEGKYVASFTWISLVEVMTAANPNANYSAGAFPVMKDAKSVGFFANTPQVMAISARSKHPEEAQMFLDYFFNNEKAMETLACTRSIPPTAKAREICAGNGSMSDILAACADNAASYSGIVDDGLSYSQEGRQLMIDLVEALGFGSVTAQDAATQMQSAYEELAQNNQ